MPLHIKTLLSYVGAVGIISLALFFFAYSDRTQTLTANNPASTTPSVELEVLTEIEPSPSSTPNTTQKEEAPQKESALVASAASTSPPEEPVKGEENSDNAIMRIKNPYSFPPYSFDTVNLGARAAVVNIFCSPRSGSNKSIIGSGIFIDSRGIILTNAHVGQYVLLSGDPRVDLSCVIRHGSPSRALWRAEVLYIPPVWIEKHAGQITVERSKGTGEHDYALLRVTATLDGTPLLESFPTLPFDIRERIGFLDDTTLTVSYPAEFLNGANAETLLYPVTSLAVIQELLTFRSGSVDLVSVGGVAGAQGGSSGGGIVNAWGYLIGIISTTSEGATTAERDLRAITLYYIDRDLKAERGSSLAELLSGDIAAKAASFKIEEAPALIDLLVEELSP